MKTNRGSISLLTLLICSFLATSSLIFSYFLQHEYQQHLTFLRSQQLQLLGTSALEFLQKQEAMPTADSILLTTTLYPHAVPATLSYAKLQGRDGQIIQHKLLARCQAIRHILSYHSFTLHPDNLELAQSYGIISAKKVVGAEYLPEGRTYTSNREFIFPQTSFLTNNSVTLDVAEVRLNGFDGLLHYTPSINQTLTIQYNSSSNKKIHGPGIIIAKGSIVIKKNTILPDSLILISEAGTITLEENVTLGKALLFSHGAMTIGAGCQVNGLVFANNSVLINGPISFTKDIESVARFISTSSIVSA